MERRRREMKRDSGRRKEMKRDGEAEEGAEIGEIL